MQWNSLGRGGWSRWHLLGVAAMLAVAIAVTREALLDIIQIARPDTGDEEASHILLVPVVMA